MTVPTVWTRTASTARAALLVLLGASLSAAPPAAAGAGPAVPPTLDRRPHPTLGRARPALTDEQRSAALDSAGAMYDSLAGLVPAEQNLQMALWLRTRPEFEAAGVSPDGCAWGRFTDGRLVVFVNNREPMDTAAPPAASAAGPPRQSLPGPAHADALVSALIASDPPSEVPGTSKVLVGNALGDGYSNLIRYMYLCFTGAPEYTVRDPPATVGTLLDTAFTELSVFAWDSHGGSSQRRDKTQIYAIGTATRKSLAQEVQYRHYLDAQELAYMYASWDNKEDASTGGWDRLPPEYHYAFTAEWVRKEMTFTPGSLVVINACTSANTDLRDAFLARNASLYAGWTDISRYSEPVAIFIDRLIGANRLGPSGPDAGNPRVPPKESPKQRAFDWKSVLRWMSSNGYDFGSSEGGHLARFWVTPNPSDAHPLGLLAPSLAFLRSRPYGELVYLYGLFGADPGIDGTVSSGEVQLDVQSWGRDGDTNMDRITARLPSPGAGVPGDLRVTVRGHRSNIRQFSLYRGKVKLTHDTGDGRKYVVEATVRFRVDLGSFRTEPGGEPQYLVQRIFADTLSDANYSFSGSVAGDDGALVWEGAGSLTNSIDGNTALRSFSCEAKIDAEHHKLYLMFFGGIGDGYVQKIVDESGHVVSSQTLTAVFGNDRFDGKEQGTGLGYAEIPLGDDWSIPKDHRTATGFPDVTTLYSGWDTVTLEWERMECQHPPDPDAAQ